ncbi:MAG: flagellar motor protein MotB [Alphaproteobacteria bacterium]
MVDIKHDTEQPIIIVKKKARKHAAHHGGAWKIAYADYITAMMAFFLVLWLVGVMDEEQLAGMADYFAKESATTEQSEGERALGGVQISQIGLSEQEKEKVESLYEKLEEKNFGEVEENMHRAIEESPELKDLENNLLIERTPEGLRIQIIDQDGRSMFNAGSAIMQRHMRRLLAHVTKAIAPLPNMISLTGHTDAVGYAPGAKYTNWELSADRANASRQAIVSFGLDPNRIRRVVGMSSRELLTPEDPASPQNRRLSILLIKQSLAPIIVAPEASPLPPLFQ